MKNLINIPTGSAKYELFAKHINYDEKIRILNFFYDEKNLKKTIALAEYFKTVVKTDDKPISLEHLMLFCFYNVTHLTVDAVIEQTSIIETLAPADIIQEALNHGIIWKSTGSRNFDSALIWISTKSTLESLVESAPAFKTELLAAEAKVLRKQLF